jgi:hypothetical protein
LWRFFPSRWNGPSGESETATAGIADVQYLSSSKWNHISGYLFYLFFTQVRQSAILTGLLISKSGIAL